MASKTIDHMEFYVAVTPYKHETVHDEVFNTINVCVAYRKGTGFVAYYHPGWSNGPDFGCVFDFSNDPLTAGFTMTVQQATKNSVARLETMLESLKLAKDGIRYFFDKRDWKMLHWLLENAARVGYTPSIADKVQEHMAAAEQAPTPNDQTTNNLNNQKTNNPNNQETMAQNVKGADLIGKTIVNKEGSLRYRVINVDGDKLQVEFVAGDRPAIQMPMPLAQVEKLLAGGWTMSPDPSTKEGGETAASKATADEDVEEVSDVQPEPAKTVRLKTKIKQAPKTEQAPKSKQAPKSEPKEQEKPKETGRFVYSTYENAKGKTCARIRGLKEDDAAYKNAADLHASATYERDKKGNKHFLLIFGPRYAAAAKEVCDAMNAGKPLTACKAIIDQATEERQQKRAEYLAGRESEEPKAKDTASEKTYTESYLADLLTRATNKDAKALAELNKIMAKAA